MPIFVCSLFLPYTIDFHDLPTPARRPSPPPRIPSRRESAGNIHEQKPSLFSKPQPTPPTTPGANAALEEFFVQRQPSAVTHFPKPNDPRSLVRSDSHIPEWTHGSGLFKQPRSTAPSAPPDTILEYQKALSQTLNQDVEQIRRRSTLRSPPNGKSRNSSQQKWGKNFTVEPAVQGNGGLYNAVRAALDNDTMEDVFWVGTVGFPTDALSEAQRNEIEEKLETEYDSHTVYVSDADFDGHYAHYCKTILWPVFHYQIPDHPKSKAYEDHSWKFYHKLNQQFADRIVKSYKRGDVIWIHDYHLLLVPKMVRDKLPDAQIGFFLHTAFPSSEVFRCLATRKELLEGMLGANMVAFQTQEYAHHFLQTCSRILVVEATSNTVVMEDRFINVAWLAIGIDPKSMQKAREEGEVKEWIKVIQERYKGKHLIVARDKLDAIRGVRQKLLAYELFLNKYPEWREKVVLVQVATATTENTDLAATVSDIVTRIDSMHSTLAHQPLVFLRQDIAFSQYVALLTVADCLMITSLREGMNLTVHEFILCQDGTASDKKHAPVILSEFTGSAAAFNGQELSVNPWDYQKCADAIKTALEMDDVEKSRRYNKMREVVLHHTGEYWVRRLNNALAKCYEEHQVRDTMSVPRLSVSQLSEKYKNSEKRIFIIDYEGTLASYGNPTSIVLTSPQRALDALTDLMADPKNHVYVMSGRSPEELERLFLRIPNLGIIAENGCFVREYGADEWVAFADRKQTQEWKESVKNILQYYNERLDGSWIEERHCSLIFHYEKVEDIDAASRQAGDCANHINDACETQKVHAIPVGRTVIIEPYEWSKGTAATHIFQNLRRKNVEVQGKQAPDFLFVAGDDREDEIIFRWANDLGREGIVRDVTTVSVGKRNTEAQATLTQGTTGLLSTLQKLAKLSQSSP